MFKLANLVVLLSTFCVVAIAAPYQELPPKAGYVPVYIREGNTPLSQVNPKLVEGFKEDESNVPQLKAEMPKEVEVNSNNTPDEAAEDKEQEKQEDENKQLAEDNEEQKQDKEIEQETPASDIAEFTSDDIKALSGNKTDN